MPYKSSHRRAYYVENAGFYAVLYDIVLAEPVR
jgi:hypothetical protein